ncbi:MAG: ribonuclease E activity regulator RraA [Candidatus Promineifilaceae bacterium]|nr:ribonuclease E activity regulator RraA [Candidatus Promineifilaceae bacterium]
MEFKTADLYDRFSDDVQVADPLLHDYGGVRCFSGPMVTLDVYEDDVLVRETLEEPGDGRVLVIDGGGSTRCALLGRQVAQLAHDNGWAGVVIHGAIRNVAQVSEIAIGLKALTTVPRASRHMGRGELDRPLHFASVTFRPGHYLYADADGIVVAPRDLLNASER